MSKMIDVSGMTQTSALAQASPLTGLRMLIVEDEALVAMLVEDLISEMGCVVVDVAGTLDQGLAIVADHGVAIDGAILDVNLGGEKVFPIADALTARGVKFIFATGYGTASFDPRYAHHAVLAKPYRQETLENLMIETWT